MIGSIIGAISRGGKLPFEYLARPVVSAGRRARDKIGQARQTWRDSARSGNRRVQDPNTGFAGNVANPPATPAQIASSRNPFQKLQSGIDAYGDMVGSGMHVFGNMMASKAGMAAMAGGAAYMGGSAIKGFSEEYQKTQGFEQMSSAGQMAFKSTAFAVGTALQVKGAFGSAGSLAGAAGMARTSKALNYVANAPAKLAKGLPKMAGKVMTGTAKIGLNTVRGTAAFTGNAAKSTAIGAVYGPKQGLDAFGSYIATARNPYLGAMGVGAAAGTYKALDSRKAKAGLTPRTTGTQGMNRSNYDRVSNRARRMGM